MEHLRLGLFSHRRLTSRTPPARPMKPRAPHTCLPALIVGLLADDNHRPYVINAQQVPVSEHLPEAQTELALFVCRTDRLHFGNKDDAVLRPAEIVLWIADDRGARLLASGNQRSGERRGQHGSLRGYGQVASRTPSTSSQTQLLLFGWPAPPAIPPRRALSTSTRH
jgi:hypothetical protein